MAEFCKTCWLAINRDANAADVIETSYNDYCERCGKFGKVVESVRTRAVKGQEYDFPMFDVRCK